MVTMFKKNTILKYLCKNYSASVVRVSCYFLGRFEYYELTEITEFRDIKTLDFILKKAGLTKHVPMYKIFFRIADDVRSGNIESIDRILSSDFMDRSPESVDDLRRSVMRIAIFHGNDEVLKHLLSKKEFLKQEIISRWKPILIKDENEQANKLKRLISFSPVTIMFDEEEFKTESLKKIVRDYALSRPKN